MEKPKSIKVFDALFAAAMMLGIGSLVINWNDVITDMRVDSQMTEGASTAIVIGLALSYGIIILLWFLISRRHSNVARWIFAVLTLWGFGIDLFDPTDYAADLGADAIYWASNILWAVMLVCLFLPSSAPWFSKQRRGRLDVRNTFD